MNDFERELTPLEAFERLLFKERVKGEKVCKGQLPALRRMWPMVLTELQQKPPSWWQKVRGWIKC